MREVIETKTIYTWESSTPEIRENIKARFHDTYDHGDFMLQDRIDTLKAIAKTLGGRLDYSLSVVPDRGEYISIKESDYRELDFCALYELIDGQDVDCPFTGCCYDHDFIDAFLEKTEGTEEANLKYALSKYIDAIHSEYQSMLEDDYMAQMCASNGYEFTSDGRIY